MKPQLLLLLLLLAQPVAGFSVRVESNQIVLGDSVSFWFEGTLNQTIRYRIECAGEVVRPTMITTVASKRGFTPKAPGECSIIGELKNQTSAVAFTVSAMKKELSAPNQQGGVKGGVLYQSSSIVARGFAKDILLAVSVLLCCGMLLKHK